MIKLQKLNPKSVERLIESHFLSKKARISIYYCTELRDLEKMQKSFDLSHTIVKEIDPKSKTIKFYKVAYGNTKIYRFVNKKMTESDLGEYRVYYTEIKKRG